ncbi:CAP domain-containing protein [Rossellomorea sp. BNER]|uniref:CAP domain-containing protein n=1 Tax=Rossellomorea sp. BNER TaxID=2962031 RepID=UPI003AF1EB5F|nr:CAP domain-containing protein [Rossellomorea sp. BNER]
MRQLFLLIMMISIAFISKPLWEEQMNQWVDIPSLDLLAEKLDSVKENPDVETAIDSINSTFHALFNKLEDSVENDKTESPETNKKNIDKPTLATPTEQTFSVSNIVLGDKKVEVEETVGLPQRYSRNEYGVDWFSYHENYHNFMMVSYNDKNQVNGLYTNQDLIASSIGIKIGSAKESVQKNLGEPLTKIRKGLVYYQLQDNGEYEVYKLDNSFVTIFYDKHENNSVTAIQIISEELENNKSNIYADSNSELKKGFEYQLFDLTNATRVNHHLPTLTFNDHVKETARKHSLDMADNHYFSHTNLQGQSPFDRMQEDEITFVTAGENLAYGQYSSIFAHEGLMNSMGHRKNILKPDYEYLGVGVAFNSESQPYYTENFFSN